MEKKKIEIPLITLIIIVLIIILILGAFIYYFLKNSTSQNSLDNLNTSIQEINSSNAEQINDDSSLNVVQSTNINTDSYNQNANSDSQVATSNTSVTNNPNINNSNASVSTPNVTNDFSSYIGVWRSDLVLDSGIPDEEFIINSITNNAINFDYIKYRISSFDNVTAQLTNNTANFEVFEDNISVKGTVTLSNNTVVLTVNSSTFEYIKPGVYTFKNKAQNSVLK